MIGAFPVSALVIFVLVVAVLGYLIALYNGIVAKANRCDTCLLYTSDAADE